MSFPLPPFEGKDPDAAHDLALEALSELEAPFFPWTEVEPFEPIPVRPAKSHYVETTEIFPRSPCLLSIWNGPNRDAEMSTLYAARKGKGPLVEEIPSDPSLVWVTFLYKGDEDTRSVFLTGGPTTDLVEPLSRFGRSNIWYLTERAATDSRFGYNFEEENFEVNGGMERVVRVIDLLDELNPEFTLQGASQLLLPNAPEESKCLGSEKSGWVVFEECLESKALGMRRRYDLYVPSGKRPKGIVVFFDGEAFASGWPELEMGSFMPTPSLLDRLIDDGRLPPMLAVFVRAGNTRNMDLVLNPRFAEFITDELLPKVARNDHILIQPERVIVAGASLGGLCAAYIALQRPDAIGNVLSLSGSFWVDRPAKEYDFRQFREGAVQKSLLASGRLPVKFFLENGIYEGANIVLTNRQLRDILVAKGYDVSYREYAGNHDFTHWASGVIDGLQELTHMWDR
jgi:enterochelin esterase-like enzyme